MVSKTAFINGIMMAWDDVGEGPAILLIHGFPLCREMWRPQLACLVAAGYRVIAPDLRGFGQSDAPVGACSMDDYADDLLELLDHLGVERVVGVGMSMGGYILFNLLARFPERLSAAVFLVTRALPDDAAARQRRLQMVDAVRQQGPQAVADTFIPLMLTDETRTNRPKLAEEVYAWMVTTATSGLAGALLAMRERPDATPLLASLHLPCLAIAAEHDPACPQDVVQMISDGITGCRFALIHDAAHLVNLERPGELNRELVTFLRDVAPTPLNTEAVLCHC